MHIKTLEGLSYSDALTYCKMNNGGIRAAREGWNGKGMYIIFFSPVSNGLETITIYDNEEGTTLPLRPFLMMKDATGCYVPWTVSQTDSLENDWCIFEEESTLVRHEEPCDPIQTEEEAFSDSDEDNTSYELFKSFNAVMQLLNKSQAEAKPIHLSKIPLGQHEKFVNLADELSNLVKNANKDTKVQDEEDLELANILSVNSKEGKKILSDFLVKNMYDKIYTNIKELIQKLEEKKAEAAHREETNKLYNGSTLFNTFFCTNHNIFIPEGENTTKELIDSLYKVVFDAHDNGYNYVQLMDGNCLKLELDEDGVHLNISIKKS